MTIVTLQYGNVLMLKDLLVTLQINFTLITCLAAKAYFT